MSLSVLTPSLDLGKLAIAFMQNSAGHWHSQRRYYTLKTNEVQEVESVLTVRFLSRGTSELQHLAQLHQLEDINTFIGGSEVAWESNYTRQNCKPIVGSTVFGIGDNRIYRDRGFATSRPLTAEYDFPGNNAQILRLRTEYNGSVFEEEIKLIGMNYRTRQTIISRAGEELTIGQYLEKRI